jgi:predicted CXXCH cytochrome family protein
LGGANGGATDYSTVSPTSKNQEPVVPDTEICFKCHDYATYVTSASGANTNFSNGTGFNLHAEHMNNALTTTTCYTCHDTHGSEQQHLINFDASVAVPVAGFNSQSAWAINGNVRSCSVSCHGMTHNPVTYDPTLP